MRRIVFFEPLVLAFAGSVSAYAFAPYNFSLCIIISILLLLSIINKSDVHLSQAQSSHSALMHRLRIHSYMYNVITASNSINFSNRRILGYGLIYGLSYFGVQLYWVFYSLYFIIKANFWLSVIAMAGFSASLAVYYVLTIYLYTYIKTNSTLFNNIVLFPSVLVFFEWVRGWFLGGFAWCDTGYTQVNSALFHGYFTVVGEYGVSWLVVSLSGALYCIIRSLLPFKLDPKAKQQYRLSLVYLALMIVVGYVLEPIQYTKPYGKPNRVALIQGNIGIDTKWSREDNLSIYLQLVKNAKADIIMLPETGISQFAMNLPTHYLADLEKAARDNNSGLVIGIPVIVDESYNYVNTAMVLTTSGHPYYAKYHLVPYGEYIPAKWLLGPLYNFINLPMVGFTAGAENQPPLLVGNQKIAFNICFENGFGSELITAAANSTIMANLSDMVWYGTTNAMYQHLQLSQARALENQRYFIQETNTGISAIIDPHGQIQSQLPSFKRQVLTDMVYGMVGVTPYEQLGNYPIVLWCSLMILATLLIKLWRRN